MNISVQWLEIPKVLLQNAHFENSEKEASNKVSDCKLIKKSTNILIDDYDKID